MTPGSSAKKTASKKAITRKKAASKRPVRKKTSAKRRRPTRPTPKPRKVKIDKSLPRAVESDITLKPSKGSSERGGGPGGESWLILYKEKRVGVVFINLIDEPPVGKHASLQIFLNAKSQGRGIGRIAYRMGCEASQYVVIYAHIRKSNDASWRAADAAGFKNVTPPGHTQLIYQWDRAKPSN